MDIDHICRIKSQDIIGFNSKGGLDSWYSTGIIPGVVSILPYMDAINQN